MKVCHHGTSGGGHYTCYNFNPVTELWYEFDDSLVRQVDLATVLASEAYVLFYRKVSEGMEVVRSEVQRLSGQHSRSDSLLRHYIANAWLAKLDTVAEPGPIDNSSVICQHGGVRYNRVDTAAALCTAVHPEVLIIMQEDNKVYSVKLEMIFRCGAICIQLLAVHLQ